MSTSANFIPAFQPGTLIKAKWDGTRGGMPNSYSMLVGGNNEYQFALPLQVMSKKENGEMVMVNDPYQTPVPGMPRGVKIFELA